MISCFIYSAIVKKTNPSLYNYRSLRKKEKWTLIKISVLFVLNLVLSNSSIQFNSLALDQVIIVLWNRYIDVSLLYSCYYSFSWIHAIWKAPILECIFISHSYYYWYYVSLLRRCIFWIGWLNRSLIPLLVFYFLFPVGLYLLQKEL